MERQCRGQRSAERTEGEVDHLQNPEGQRPAAEETLNSERQPAEERNSSPLNHEDDIFEKSEKTNTAAQEQAHDADQRDQGDSAADQASPPHIANEPARLVSDGEDGNSSSSSVGGTEPVQSYQKKEDEDRTEKTAVGQVQVSRLSQDQQDVRQFHLKSSAAGNVAEMGAKVDQAGKEDENESQNYGEFRVFNEDESQKTSLHKGSHHIDSWHRSE